MSFLDDLVSVGKSTVKFLGGDGIGSSLARTALTAYALNRVVSASQKKNEVPQTRTVTKVSRVSLNPNPEHRIPVVYGQATLTGTVTDARQNSGLEMFYCVTICERTGNLNLGDGAGSEFSLLDVYWNDNRLIFREDGVTVKGYYDRSQTFNTDIDGLISVYFFNGNSERPKLPNGYTSSASLINAYGIMPGWTSAWMMSDLVFAVVRVNYDTEKNVKGIENLKFKIKNSMTLPGDCLYDMMTNTRYGAGIAEEEIYKQ
jgi:hypothetical protein